MSVHYLNTGTNDTSYKGGEPPDNDGMEGRVGKLEDFANDTRGRLSRMETTLTHVEKEVSNFKWWMLGAALTIILTVIGTVVGTGVGIQQMTVSTFQAAAQNGTGGNNQQPIIINIPATPSK